MNNCKMTDEELGIKAVEYALAYCGGLITLSMIQRKFDVSYNHAGRVVDWLEDNGYIESLGETLDAKRKGRLVVKKA